MRRTPKKTDANHAEIVAALRSAHASVFDVHIVPGGLDLIIGVAGIDQRIEVKDGAQPPSRQRLTPLELETFGSWRGRRPVIVRDVDEALALVEDLRRIGLLHRRAEADARRAQGGVAAPRHEPYGTIPHP